MLWIDPPVTKGHGRLWSHLVSDTSLEELLAFGHRLKLHPRSFDADHYDVPSERYDEVVAGGARPTTGADLLRRLVASGLRVPKRKGERVLAWHETTLGAEPARWELLSSAFVLEPVRHEILLLRGESVLVQANGALPVAPQRPQDAAPVGHARVRATTRRESVVETLWWRPASPEPLMDDASRWVALDALATLPVWPLIEHATRG